ncbi:HNH endonuclease [uncultured Desulfuromonas sp.]|uniref:HNH endonuclease n=1 Tax=uncultured Desulfuromonas sp. TaxID=181013 RepID=UPI002AAAD472|nr:HNH endonuclease [uncultured Desulfuromonas sp.]
MTFYMDVPEEQLRKERAKARELRKTGWWKNRVAEGRCYYCGEHFPPKELTLDHVVPLVRGGKTTKGNCVAACKACNSKKKDLLPSEWEEYLQTLSHKDHE